MATSGTFANNPALYPKLQYDPLKDFAPIANIGLTPQVLVTSPKSQFNSVKDLVAKARTDEQTYGSSGNGSTSHLTAELFRLTTATDILHVPFRGSAPAVSALLGGHVDMSFDAMPSIWAVVKAGNLRPLGVAAPSRLRFAPDLPTIAETLPGFEVTAWEGVLAPAGTPKEIVAKISAEMQRIGKDPEFVKSMLDVGAVVGTSTPEEFETFVASDYVKWQQVINKAEIKVD